MHSEKHWDVIIAGGSLAGLVYGIILKRQGYSVCILERAESSIRLSKAAGIGIAANGQKFLEQYDLLHQTNPLGFPVSGSANYHPNGKLKSQLTKSFRLSTWDALYYRLRANFDGYTSQFGKAPDALPGDGESFYATGNRVTNFSVVGDTVEVICEDLNSLKQRKHQCAMLIGADGLNSTIKRVLVPQTKMTYSGYVMWRGTVPISKLSSTSRSGLERLRAFILPNNIGYVVVYGIPGEWGTLEDEERHVNFVWYEHATDEILVDSDGHKHRTTLPRGKMLTERWAAQVEKARYMPSAIREICEKIEDHSSRQ